MLELGHTVIAFEPQPECVREIKARCSPYKKNLQIQETALGDAPGVATMFVRAASCQSSLDASWEGKPAGSFEVPVSTLDLAIQKFGIPQYCKIDVEGWELHVLSGLSQPIPLVSFEYHQEDDQMQKAFACLDRLSSLGSIEINITPAETTIFGLSEWLDATAFKAAFKEKFEGNQEFLFGDLFIKMK